MFVCLLLAPLAGAEGASYTHSGTLSPGLVVYSAFDDHTFAALEGDHVRAVLDWSGAPGSSIVIAATMGSREDEGCRVTDVPCIVDGVVAFDPMNFVCDDHAAIGMGEGGQLVLDFVVPADDKVEITVSAGLAPSPLAYTLTQNGAAPEDVHFRAYAWGIGGGAIPIAACQALG